MGTEYGLVVQWVINHKGRRRFFFKNSGNGKKGKSKKKRQRQNGKKKRQNGKRQNGKLKKIYT
jgi:hypothetical protein